jgi:hypothetical protein
MINSIASDVTSQVTIGPGGRVDQRTRLGQQDRDIRKAYHKALLSLSNFWYSVTLYLKGMLKVAGQGVPLKDRQARSKALLASSSLTKPFLENYRSVANGGIPLANVQAINAQNSFDIGTDFTNPLPQSVPRESVDTGRRTNQGSGRYVGGAENMDTELQNLQNYIFNSGNQMVRREDTEHGYVGWGPAEYSENQRDVFAFQSGQYQDNTGGRPRGFFGEEEAEYANDVAALNAVDNTALTQGVMLGDEQGKLASKVAPGGVPSMMSSQDPDGTYDIQVQRQKNDEAQKKALLENTFEPPPKSKEAKEVNLKMKSKEVNFVPPSVAKVVAPETACPPKYGGKKYTAKDIPKDADGLIKFIGGLHQKHKGYSQAVYAKKDMKVANVRRNTIKKLKGAGLM